jgi:hypothetical protein
MNCAVFLLTAFVLTPWNNQAGPASTAAQTSMTLDVDATDAPLKILHATMTMAAKPGEERRVFGDVGHYRKYHWLLTLSDNLGSFGVEHHECADDRVAENTFVDEDTAKRSSLLLPHEFFHSWNGKARRPIGLMNGGTVQIDYHGGLRYPHLERVAGKDEVLTQIAAPRVQ